MSRLVVIWCGLAVLAGTARADRPLRALAVEAGFGYGNVYGPPSGGDPQIEDGGPIPSLGVHLRSQHFLTPFLALAHEPLAVSQGRVALGHPEDRRSVLSSFAIGAGGGVSFWRFQVRGGISLSRLAMTSKTDTRTLETSEWDLGYILGLRGTALSWDRAAIGLAAQVRFIVEADLTVVSGGLWFAYEVAEL